MKLLPAPLSIINTPSVVATVSSSSTSSSASTNNINHQNSMEGLNTASSPMHFGSDFMWRLPLGFPLTPQTPTSPLVPSDFNNHLPNGLAHDPRAWTHQDVINFLKWCQREFDLRPFDFDKFQLNGKALCLLTKNDLSERAPNAGDVVYNVLHLLIRDSQSLQRTLPSSPITPTSRYSYTYPATNWQFVQQNVEGFHSNFRMSSTTHQFLSNSVALSPAPSLDSQTSSPRTTDNTVANQASAIKPMASHQSDSDDDSDQDNGLKISTSPPLTPLPRSPIEMSTSAGTTSAFKREREFFPSTTTVSNVNNNAHEYTTEPNTNGRLLWDFLQQLLNDPSQRYNNYICWKNRDIGIFKIVDPAGLARLWGIQKNHLSMNYDKMSRALRYYYRVNILRKVQGERHCYQFLCNPTEMKSMKNISLLRQQIAQSKNATTSTGSGPTIALTTTSINHQQKMNSNDVTFQNIKKEFENNNGNNGIVDQSSELHNNQQSMSVTTEELPFDLRITNHSIENSMLSNSIKVEK